MTKHTNKEDHLVLEALTEGSEAGALLLLLGKMLFLTHSTKGNPLGGLHIHQSICMGFEYTDAAAICGRLMALLKHNFICLHQVEL